MKNHSDLNEEEQQELRGLLGGSPGLAIADELKEELRDIYETTTPFKIGLRRLKQWLIYATIIFGQTGETLSKHLTDICHDFINHTTNGIMEGMNNRIQLILRQSYGFKNFELMREKLLACLFK